MADVDKKEAADVDWSAENAKFLTARVECDIHEMKVIGEIPQELNGGFFTVGPEPQYLIRSDVQHKWFNGDGMMTAIYIQNGKASHKSRFVRTERFNHERKAGRSLFGEYRNPWTDDKSCEGVNPGTANTTMLFHAGKLQAYKEDSLPVEINPTTLETIGMMNYGEGELLGPNMSAHPKLCPKTGELINVGNMANGTKYDISKDYVYYVFSPEGEILKKETFTGPWCGQLHDFVITEQWMVIAFFPLIADKERMMKGGVCWQWEGNQKVHVCLIRRDGSAKDAIWLETDTQFNFHYFNAYDEDGKVIIDLCPSESFDFNVDILVSDNIKDPNTSYITRWTIDPVAKTLEAERLSEFYAEVPKIDERYTAVKHKYGYVGMLNPEFPPGPAPWAGSFNCVGRINFETREVESGYVGPNGSAQEPLFVPRAEGCEEGDGFLIQPVPKPFIGMGAIVIFDAQKVADGPLATIEIPYPLAPRIHGEWVDASLFEMPTYS